jgi:hypothetical protein
MFELALCARPSTGPGSLILGSCNSNMRIWKKLHFWFLLFSEIGRAKCERGYVTYVCNHVCIYICPYPCLSVHMYLRGPFANFVDSPYYSESELCGGAVTVCLSKYLPWQAMHFLQRSTHLSKTCCRPLITSKFIASELHLHGRKSPGIAWHDI